MIVFYRDMATGDELFFATVKSSKEADEIAEKKKELEDQWYKRHRSDSRFLKFAIKTLKEMGYTIEEAKYYRNIYEI